MSIWNKVLVGLIALAALAMFFMGLRTLKTHQYWRDITTKLAGQLADVEAANREMTEGKGDALGTLRQSALALRKAVIGQGRIWRGCEKQGVDEKTGQVRLRIAAPAAGPIGVKAVLLAFEDKNVQEGGRFLGEFRVKDVVESEKQLVLEPTRKLTAVALQRLVQSPGPVTLYELTPEDKPEAFAGLEDAQIQSLIPPTSVEEYLKDGKPATAEAPKNVEISGVVVRRFRDAEGKYVRQLQDYNVLLGRHAQRLSALTDLREAAVRDAQSLEAAVADAKRQEKFRQDEIAQLKLDKEKFLRERDDVAEHQKQLQSKLAAVQASIQELIKSNQDLARQIAKIQVETLRRVDQQTRNILSTNGAGR